jgi:hypothetical protein
LRPLAVHLADKMLKEAQNFRPRSFKQPVINGKCNVLTEKKHVKSRILGSHFSSLLFVGFTYGENPANSGLTARVMKTIGTILVE